MIVGIDLGTTNSAVAIWREGRAELILNSLGAVSYTHLDVYKRQALSGHALGPDRVTRTERTPAR